MTDTNQDSKTVEAVDALKETLYAKVIDEHFSFEDELGDDAIEEMATTCLATLTAQGYQHVGPDHVVVPRKITPAIVEALHTCKVQSSWKMQWEELIAAAESKNDKR